MSGVYSIPRSVRNVCTVGVYHTVFVRVLSKQAHRHGALSVPKIWSCRGRQQHFWKQIIMVAEFNHEFIANIIHPVDEIIII